MAFEVHMAIEAAKELPNHEKVNVHVVRRCSIDAGWRPFVRSQRHVVQQSHCVRDASR
jgi:hypothetical protein